MKIVSYIRGRYLGSEDPAEGYQTYLGCVAVMIGVDPEGMDNHELYNFAFSRFDSWFEDLVENHEVHLVTYHGDRILEQYLVTKDQNGV